MTEEQVKALALRVQAIIRSAGYPDAVCKGQVNLAPFDSSHWFVYGVAVFNGELRHAVRFWSADVSAIKIARMLLSWLNRPRRTDQAEREACRRGEIPCICGIERDRCSNPDAPL